MKPSVGRVVHYVAFGTPNGEFPAGEHRAAVVTEVDREQTIDTVAGQREDFSGFKKSFGQSVGLCVLNPTGMYFTRHVLQDEEDKSPGTWHWSEREA